MQNRLERYFILLILSTTIVFGDISGVGYGDTLRMAKLEALADLSQVIKSEIRTVYKSHSTDTSTKNDFKIQVSSHLPLLGVEFEELASTRNIKVKATLHSKKVTTLYSSKLALLNAQMVSILKEIKSSFSKSFIFTQYKKLYTLTKEYESYRSVIVLLDGHTKYIPVITEAKVELEILKLNSKIDSLELASNILATAFKEKNIYIYPVHVNRNSLVAEFGAVLSTLLQGKINVSNDLYSAEYILTGEYIISNEKLILNMQLLDIKNKEIVESKTLVLSKKAYEGVSLVPKGIDFNTLLTQGVAESSSLKVTLNSNKGSENLLFYDNNEIELFVKLNKMGYIYIVGYTQTKDGKFSYLLELSEGNRDSRFVKFINADDASRWISLGAFNVEAPFGVESLQVIASNKQIKKLPNVTYDDRLGYYVISHSIKKALEHTRGLRPKRSSKVESSEDVMTFTTMK